MELEKLVVRIVADYTQYLQPTQNAVKSALDAAAKVESAAKQITQAFATELPKIPALIETNIVQPMQKAAIQAQKAAKDIAAANAEAMASSNVSLPTAGVAAPAEVKASYDPTEYLRNRNQKILDKYKDAPASYSEVSHPAAAAANQVEEVVKTAAVELPKVKETIERTIIRPMADAWNNARKVVKEFDSARALSAAVAEHGRGFDPLAGLGDEFAKARAQLAALEQTSQATTRTVLNLAGASEKLVSGTTALGGVLKSLAPAIGILDVDMGLATMSAGSLAETMPHVAAAAAVFTTAVVGTTYVLHGQEAAANSLNDTLELGKYVLAGATGGFFDYTEAAQMAAKAEKDFTNQARNNAEQLAFAINTRNQMRADLEKTIREHGPFSEQEKAAFIDQHTGTLQKLGTHAKLVADDRARAGSLIDTVNNEDTLAKLQKQIELQTKSREELVLENLTRNHATEAQKQQARDLFAAEEQHKAAIKAKRDAEHEAEVAARTVAHAAKQAAIEAARQQKHEVEEQLRAQQRLADEGKRLADNLRSPQERQADELSRIKSLYDQNVISAQVYERAVAKLGAEHVKMQKTLRQYAGPVHSADVRNAEGKQLVDKYLAQSGLGQQLNVSRFTSRRQSVRQRILSQQSKPPKELQELSPAEQHDDQMLRIYGYGGLKQYREGQERMYSRITRESATELSTPSAVRPIDPQLVNTPGRGSEDAPLIQALNRNTAATEKLPAALKDLNRGDLLAANLR